MSAGDCAPAPADGCSTPVCNAGQCAVDFAPSGMDSAQQTPADCERAVCNGAGAVTEIPDDLDLPKGGACVVGSCNNGVPILTPADVAVACNGTCHCNGVGACAGPGCISDNICPQDPAGCFSGKCYGCEECTSVFAPAGQLTPLSPKGDCKVIVCNGSGGKVPQVDDTDLPNDNDPCTKDLCVNGVPSNPPLCPPPQTCTQGVCSP